ncbi:hypothetical protein [Streptomyces sp. NPDC057496]|uniref:hypothetical protein n=1 Tax=Streptomyces sp. NPDC057496 TaxID=3346149 RepID=UPI0036864884
MPDRTSCGPEDPAAYACSPGPHPGDDPGEKHDRTPDRVGVEWKQTDARSISVARRASVASMDAHVGPKY